MKCLRNVLLDLKLTNSTTMSFQRTLKFLLIKEWSSKLRSSKTNLKTQPKAIQIAPFILQLIKNQQILLINKKRMCLSDFQHINLENHQLKRNTDSCLTQILLVRKSIVEIDRNKIQMIHDGNDFMRIILVEWKH